MIGKPKVMVVVEGGAVQEVIINNPHIQIVVIDYDYDNEEEPIIIAEDQEHTIFSSKKWNALLEEKRIEQTNLIAKIKGEHDRLS